ncbi:rRNA maturation RNase YbeY [uncultured Tateyamaria sp.]|uniref:rRNA maturation RNase YbeY n=1 Tax=uncultured Tateyamaria sp. TaxID=455651 RepID=UPI00260C24DE|nr:rRNA maturation RNase YbeY [uncultured Tateyamaria sp.]
MIHDIDILIEDERWHHTDLAAVVTRAINATLDHLDIPTAELSVLGCDDAHIAALNDTFREKSTPTNVLSWPETALGPDGDGDVPRVPQADPDGTLSLGDIAIAYETCTREAQAQGKRFSDHVTHLIVHGTLHLLGYDHIRDADASRMEALEVEILGILGIADPY